MNSSLLSYLYWISTSLCANALRSHSDWFFSVWIMHPSLRNFPVNMRQMAHTATYWQQVTGKQNRELQRNNRETRLDRVWINGSWNSSSQMMRKSAECWYRHGWSVSECDWRFIQRSMDFLHLFASGKRLSPLEKPRCVRPSSFSTSANDGISPADVFIKQS